MPLTQSQLVATPNNPIPPNASVFSIRAADGRRLRAASFAPPHGALGTIALFQGRAEFIEKYFETIGELLARGFHVVTLDWRGQGASDRELADPRKGHVDDFALYQRDLDVFITDVLALSCPQPWRALAHSMGAAILLDRAHSARSPFERLILTAPMIDLAGLRFPIGARALADTLDMFGLGAVYVPGGGPKSLVEQPFEGNLLTSDPGRYARAAETLRVAPWLTVGDPTIGWANAAFRLMKQFSAPAYPRAVRAPAMLFACGRDRLVSSRAIERFTRRLPIASLVEAKGARHELLMERDELREQFWAAFDAFVPGEAPVSA